MPGMLTAPAAPQFSPPPAIDESNLRLVAVRKLWDAGTLVANSRSLAGLHPEPAARMNPDELFRMDIAEGTQVRVSSSRGSIVLPVRADSGVTPGSVAIPFNLPGVTAATLIDSSLPVTEVRVERAELSLRGAGPRG
jgi:anaerobic selenocysteine-containing dehydrogenase